jgi:tetratricopeptide (TPR) repeat protein
MRDRGYRRCVASPCTRAAVAFLAAAALSGCASLPAGDQFYGNSSDEIELTGTPFYPQEMYQCGPAALMTLLTDSGVQTTMEALVQQVYLPARNGSLQIEMLAATRAAGRLAYLLEPTLAAVIAELEAGRPVLVLQNLGVSWFPRWHYAVVVGVNPATGKVTLRSGTDARRETNTTTFVRTWQRGDYWAFVALRPGELPANANAQRYFVSVSALEQSGHAAAAHAAWQAGLDRWPNEPVALFGMANAEYQAGHYAAAETLYRRLLEQDAGLKMARNNLALALAGQGKQQEALRQVHLVIDATDPNDAYAAEYRASLAKIEAE